MIPSLASSRVTQHWWVPLVRGLISIVFGIFVFAFPISSIFAFVILIGAYFFVDGIANVVTAIRFAHPDTGRWWAILAQGVIGIAIGITTFFLPGLTAASLGFLIAFWAVITGVFEIAAALRLRRDVPGEIFLIVAGILSVVVGVVLFANPAVALVALTWIVGFYAILGGLALVALAFRLRGRHTRTVAV